MQSDIFNFPYATRQIKQEITDQIIHEKWWPFKWTVENKTADRQRDAKIL